MIDVPKCDTAAILHTLHAIPVVTFFIDAHHSCCYINRLIALPARALLLHYIAPLPLPLLPHHPTLFQK